MVEDQGDEQRTKLFAIAYRMLGSATEAEDVVQEAYARFYAQDRASVESAAAFLRTIVIRLCLDVLKSARIQRETYPGVWLPEPIVAEAPAPDPLDRIGEYESLSIAFLLLLESLSPEERAVFLMREVFDYSYNEIATALDKSESACRQVFSRARKHITDHRPRFSAAPYEHHAIASQFILAVQSGNIQDLMALLTENVVSVSDGGGKASAAMRPLFGRELVARLVIGLFTRYSRTDEMIKSVMVNGRESALISAADGQPQTLITLDIANGAVQGIYFVRNPDKLKQLLARQ